MTFFLMLFIAAFVVVVIEGLIRFWERQEERRHAPDRSNVIRLDIARRRRELDRSRPSSSRR